MKIFTIASEVAPFAKTGGLADVTGSLPLELKKLGHQASIFLPKYKSVDEKKWNLELVLRDLPVPVGSEKLKAKVFRYVSKEEVEYFFLDYPDYFCRDELYGTPLHDYPDNDLRFTFFQRAFLETLKALKITPDIIHCHDWQTGLVPAYLKTLYAKESVFSKTRTIFTIHNLAYQGNFPPDSFALTGISWDQFRFDKLEFYGKVSFLKAGIVYSDAITTVSPRYSDEIQTQNAGCGMEGALTKRSRHIYGITNGLNYEEWNPRKDPEIEAHYHENDIEKKIQNKKFLQKDNKLSVDAKQPLFGFIARLVDQKGLDILLPVLQEFAKSGIQFVLLGTGEERYHQALREIAKKNRGLFGIHIIFDLKMAKQIYAGCDALLIPSYYEPCGLAQMIAARYGTVPIVRAVGGLADTITEFNSETGNGNGFCFLEYTSQGLLGAVRRALEVYRQPALWHRLIQNAMTSDFSWSASAKKYLKLYEETKRQKVEDTSGRTEG